MDVWSGFTLGLLQESADEVLEFLSRSSAVVHWQFDHHFGKK